MDTPTSKSAESSKWRRKSAGGSVSSPFSRSKDIVGQTSSEVRSEDDWKPNLAVVLSGGGSDWNSHDFSVSPFCTISKPKSNVLKNQLAITKIAKVFHHGAVLSVDYEKHFGFLAPVAGESSAGKVYFKLPPAVYQMTTTTTTATLTRGMRLIRGDIMKYELANYNSHETSRADVNANLAMSTNSTRTWRACPQLLNNTPTSYCEPSQSVP